MASNYKLTFDVNANIGPIKQSANELMKAFGQLKLPQALQTSVDKTFSKLISETRNFEAAVKGGFDNFENVSNANRSFEKIISYMDELSLKSKEITGMDPEKLIPAESLKRLKGLREAWAKTESVISKRSGLAKDIKDENTEIKKQEALIESLNTKIEKANKANPQIGKENQKDIKIFEELIAKRNLLYTQQQEILNAGGSKSDPTYLQLKGEITTTQKTIDDFGKKINENRLLIAENQRSVSGWKIELKNAESSIEKAKIKLNELNSAADNPSELQSLREELAILKNVSIDEIPTNLEHIKKIIDEMPNKELQDVNNSFENIKSAAQGTAKPLEQAKKVLASVSDEAKRLDKAKQEMENLKNQVTSFFSMGNAVQIFKRALSSALETIKQLDKAMTETAVVTDFSIGDMWNELPRYTNLANQLGATTLGAYETMTLYYQQGLKTNEVFAVGTETMKMARIAGLDYAKATDLMTAALRGFNMEINSINAQRINDVYSELAAITAADTEEIASSMTKTASIASNAGMQFETTAAFLSQMIETTRESAENLGTAMKTIIARFQELKKAPNEIGEVDGEIVDANKIEKALRLVQISLRDTNGEFRNLDDVFLELSAKWDSLDKNTQRYIATTAAGSRQQSRFLAMMGNHERVMELVDAANNSAGASQEQFGKTLESLEAKLNKLKNAWNEYTMGIMNSNAVKWLVDTLTSLIGIINKLTNKSGDFFGGISKGLLLIGGLKLGGKIFDNIFTSMGKSFFKGGIDAGVQFNGGVEKTIKSGGFSGIKNITSEISRVFQGAAGEQLLLNKARKSGGDLVKEGISLAVAEKAAMGGLTAEKYKQLIVDMQERGMDGAEIAAEKEKIALTYAETGAKRLQMGVEKKSLISKTALWLALLFGNKETRAAALADLGRVATLTAEQKALGATTTAQMKLNAAMLAAPWGLIALGIGAVVASFFVWDALTLTNKERLEKLNKKLEKTDELLAETESKLSDLKNSRDSLKDLEKDFSSLTKGTDEWKEKLVAVNQEVLSIIDKFPALVQYMERGAEGQLTIATEGWDKLIEQQQKAVLASQIASTSYKIDQTRLQISIDEEDIKKLKMTALDPNVSAKIVEKLNESKEEYKQSLDRAAVEIENFSDIIAATALGSDPSLNELDYGNQAKIAGDYMVDSFQRMVFRAKEDIDDSDVKNLYAELTGLTLAEIKSKIKNKELTNEMMKDQLAFSAATEELISDVKDVNETFSDLEKSLGKYNGEFLSLKGLFSQNAKEMTLTGMDSLIKGLNLELGSDGLDKSIESFAIINDYLTDMGTSLHSLGISAFDFINMVEIAQDTYNSLYDGVGSSLQGIIENNILSLEKTYKQLGNSMGFTLEQTSALIKVLQKVGANGGSVDEFTASLNDMLKNVPKEDFDEVFSKILSMDLTEESLESLSGYFKEMGYEIDDSLINKLIEASNVIREFNLDKINEELKKSYELIDSIQGREETNKKFTQEEYDSLISAGAEETQFVFDGAEWTYIGGTLEELIVAVKANTLALTNESETIIDEKIATGNLFKNFADNGKMNDSFFKTDFFGLNPYKDDKNMDPQKLIEGIVSGEVEDPWVDIKAVLDEIGANKEEYSKLSGQELRDYFTKIFSESYGYSGEMLKVNEASKAAFNKQTNQAALYNVGETGGAQAVLNSGASGAEQLAVIEALSTAEEGLGDVFEETQKELAKRNSKLQGDSKLLKAHVYDTRQANKAQDELNKTISDNIDVLEAGEENSDGYRVAIGKIADETKKVFGTEVSNNFVKQHIEDFQAMADGDEEAFKRIAEAINKDFLTSLNLTNEQLSKVQLNFNALDGLNLEIGGTADFSSIFNEMVKILGDVDKAKAAIESMGYKMTYKIVGFQPIMGLDGKMKPQPIYQAVITKNASTGTGTYTPKKATGGGGSSKNNKWENPYDEFYNITEKINEAIRDREALERDYDRILKSRLTTGKAIADNIKKQTANLKGQKEQQQKLLNGRSGQLDNVKNETFTDRNGKTQSYQKAGVTSYATYDKEAGVVKIDYQALSKVTNANKGAAIEAYINRLEELANQYEDTQDIIEDINDQIEELKDIGKDEYIEIEQQVYDAIVAAEQKVIDELNETAETIHDSNQDLISALEESVNEERKARDRKNELENIESKQRRLALLKRDTSGANALEIKSLEAELGNDQLSYSDNLVDDQIASLQSENEKAYEQRQTQIDILQRQLDWNVENGAYWQLTHDLIAAGINTDGTWNVSSDVYKYLQDNSGWIAMSSVQKEAWADQMNDTLAQALAYLQKDEIAATPATPDDSSSSFPSGSSGGSSGGGSGGSSGGGSVKGSNVGGGGSSSGSSGRGVIPTTSSSVRGVIPTTSLVSKIVPTLAQGSVGNDVRTLQLALQKLGYSVGSDGRFDQKTKVALLKFQSDFRANFPYGSSLLGTPDGILGPRTKNAFKLKGYKHGGVADFTGPAWLDGTPSKPELVLNSEDSKNFIMLKDVLSNALSGSSSQAQTSGATTYEIHIEVGELANDYSVEQVADKVQRIIYEQARSRNSNSISRTR